MSEVIMRYSEAFKRQIVEEIETGKKRNQSEVREFYGIKGGATVSNWIRRYGKNDLLKKVVTVRTPEERDQIKELKHEIKKLEKVLADTAARAAINEALFEVACEEFGIRDPEEFKKKANIKLFD